MAWGFGLGDDLDYMLMLDVDTKYDPFSTQTTGLWNTSQNCMDVNNVKAKLRYSEVVKARLKRVQVARKIDVDGRTRGLEWELTLLK